MIEVVLVFRRDDERLEEARKAISDLVAANDDVTDPVQYNLTSSKFLEKRTAGSLLARHATFNTPLILFRKEGVVVRALYDEEVKDTADYPKMLFDKLKEARNAIPVIEDVYEDFED